MGGFHFDYRKWAYIVICAAGAALIGILFFRYIMWTLLPFAFSWALAFPVRQCAGFINRKTGMSARGAGFLLTAIFIIGIFALVSFIARRLFLELRTLIEYLGENPGIIGNALEDIKGGICSIAEKIPFIRHDGEDSLENVEKYLSEFVAGSISGIVSALPKIFGRIIVGLPNFIFFLIITIISSFYFCLDLTAINARVLSLFPEKIRCYISEFKRGVFRTAIKYLKSYVLLMLITFFELLVGFLIIGVDYSLLLAVVIAVIDILPILGVGTVLIPWGIFCLLAHDVRRGVALFIIYIIITVVRQYAEPRIIGSKFGIHPLMTLFAMYAGVSLFGFFGMLLGPVIVVFIKGIINRRTQAVKENISSGSAGGAAQCSKENSKNTMDSDKRDKGK